MIRVCEGCKYWSELLVRSSDHYATVEAMCLNDKSPSYETYAHKGCNEYDRDEPIDVLITEDRFSKRFCIVVITLLSISIWTIIWLVAGSIHV